MKYAPNLIRWLSLPVDPLSVEDYLANRELLGIVEDNTELTAELDLAFRIEEIRSAKQAASKVGPEDFPRGLALPVFLHGYEPVGLVEYENFVVFAPAGKVELSKPLLEIELVLDWKGLEKITVLGGNVWSVDLPSDQTAKIKVRTKGGAKIGGKGEQSWSGRGPKKLVVDGRGRPLTLLPPSKQREIMASLKEAKEEGTKDDNT